MESGNLGIWESWTPDSESGNFSLNGNGLTAILKFNLLYFPQQHRTSLAGWDIFYRFPEVVDLIDINSLIFQISASSLALPCLIMSHTPGAFAKKFQCPCCNNPWNQSESADYVATFYCSPCLADDKGYKGIDPSNFDQSIPLNENFYKWSNGGWMKNNPIPGAYSSWNTFIVLRDLNLERLRTILDDLASGSIPSTSGTQKLADYFNAFMDEDTISHRSLETDDRDGCSLQQVDGMSTVHSVVDFLDHFGWLISALFVCLL